jgi:hypothetical protein
MLLHARYHKVLLLQNKLEMLLLQNKLEDLGVF